MKMNIPNGLYHKEEYVGEGTSVPPSLRLIPLNSAAYNEVDGKKVHWCISCSGQHRDTSVVAINGTGRLKHFSRESVVLAYNGILYEKPSIAYRGTRNVREGIWCVCWDPATGLVYDMVREGKLIGKASAGDGRLVNITSNEFTVPDRRQLPIIVGETFQARKDRIGKEFGSASASFTKEGLAEWVRQMNDALPSYKVAFAQHAARANRLSPIEEVISGKASMLDDILRRG